MTISKGEQFAELVVLARQAYGQGTPVIVEAEDGAVLHGQQTLDKYPRRNFLIFEDVDRGAWDRTNTANLLERERIAWIARGEGPEQVQ